jgi:hypothetical protein
MISTYPCVHRVYKCICSVLSCSCYDIQIQVMDILPACQYNTMAGYRIYPVSILCLLDSTISVDGVA